MYSHAQVWHGGFPSNQDIRQLSGKTLKIQFENWFYFEQVLDDLEMSEPLDLAFVIIQVSSWSHIFHKMFFQLSYFLIVPMVYIAIYK